MAAKKKAVRGPVWVTKDGRKIPVREMTNEHLTNAIRFLQRAHARYVEFVMDNMPQLNGEMAQYYAEQEWLEAAGSRPEELFPIYNDLYVEAACRREERRKARA
jgi:hypothetical protein